jgi:hypothetical protein
MPGKKRTVSKSRRKGPTPRNPNRVRRSSATEDVHAPPAEPTASSRYTPKIKARGPFRPTWHKVVGALLIVLGVGIFVINDLAWFDINLIPGGHNELWAMLGIVTAASSTWWFGWFDRTPKPSR